MFTKLLSSILSVFLIFLILPKQVFAGEPPQLLSPSDGSTVSSSKLEWQTPSYSLYSGGSPYIVQVDDEQTFTNPEKNNIYLTNNYYTPQLNPGTWYWRVRAKDVDGVWSEWSNVWSFTLTSTSSSPSPSPSDSVEPTSTPIPTSTPQPTSSSSPTSSFLVSNTPSQINSDQSFNVTVNLSLPNNPNTQFYLKGAFKKSESSNYFGYTKVSGSWVKNGSSYSAQYLITTDSEGKWSGILEVKGDSEDSGFEGTGDYIFKVGRYTSTGSGPNWSNELSIKINGFANSDSNSVNQGSAPSTKKATSSPSPLSANKSSSGSIISKSNSNGSINKTTSIASVAAASIEPSPTPDVEIKAKKQINYIPIIGGVLVLSGFVSLIFLYLRKKKPNETINHPL